jgi:hypothetical protein
MTTVEPPPDDPLDDEGSEGEGKGRGFVPDFVRRMAWAGLGAVFMSEEGVRKVASQLKLPKRRWGSCSRKPKRRRTTSDAWCRRRFVDFCNQSGCATSC